jgi:hypothetical protein
MREAGTDSIHVTGMVTGYGHGFGLFLTTCSDLSAFQGVTFTLSGMAGDGNMVEFQVQTNSDFPWECTDCGDKGACTSTTPTNPFETCVAPTIMVPTSDTPTMVTWAEMGGGMPVPWNPAMSPTEVVGIQWQFPWSAAAMPYTVDVVLDDVSFIGGTDASCAMGAGGAGGGGGMGGGGAGGGGGDGGTGDGGMGGGGMGGGGNGGVGGIADGGTGGQ